MQIRRRSFILPTAAMAVSLLVALPANAKTDPAERVPDGAIVFVAVDDVANLKTSIEKQSWYRVLSELSEGSGPFADVIEQLESEMNSFAEELGLDSYKEFELPENGMGMALYLAPEPTDDPNMLVVVDSGKAMEQHRELIDKGVEKTVKEGGKRESEEYRGLKLITITPMITFTDLQRNEDGELVEKEMQEPGDPMSYAIMGEQLMFSNSLDVLKKTVRLLRDKDEKDAPTALSANPAYRVLAKKADPIGQVRFYADLAPVMELLKTEEPDSAEFVDMIGGTELKPIVGTLRFGKLGKDHVSAYVFIPAGGQDKFVNKFVGKNRPIAELAKNAGVQRNAWFYVGGMVNMGSVIDEAMKAIASMQGQDPAQLVTQMRKMPLPNNPEEAVNIYDDVIMQMTGPINVMGAINKPYGDDSLDITFSCGVGDAKVFGSSMGKLLGSVEQMGFFVSREMLDQKIYDFAMLPMMAPGAPMISMVTANEAFTMGTSSGVNARLRAKEGNKDLLTGYAGFQSLMAKLPKDGVLYFYEDGRPMMDLSIHFAESDEDANEEGDAFGGPGAGGASIMDALEGLATDMPVADLRKLRDLAALSGAVFRRTGDGWELVFVSAPAVLLEDK